jgi:hypothetical protein
MLLFIGAASTALGQADVPAPEMGTPEQRAACGPDVADFVSPSNQRTVLSVISRASRTIGKNCALLASKS